METLEYTQAGKPKSAAPPGRPSLLEIDPNLARKIIYRLADGHSMQQSPITRNKHSYPAHMGARRGQQESGAMHDIAVAVKRSKENRGFGGKHSKVDGAPLPANTDSATAPVPVPDERPASDDSVPEESARIGVKAWSSNFLDPWIDGELCADQLDHCRFADDDGGLGNLRIQ